MNDISGIGKTAVPTPSQAQTEIGWPINWAQGLGKGSYIPELDGINALRKFDTMRRTDETVGAMFWVMTSTVAQIPWTFAPCKNGLQLGRDDPDWDEALKWANFGQSCLEDMDHSWGDHIDEALTMAWAGFAPCEIVFKERDGIHSRYDDGKWGIKGLPLRDQFTVYHWTVDERNELAGMDQQTVDGKIATIPVWKLLHYRMSRVLNDPWGTSMLTNAYRPWVLKQRIQESEAIGIDRELCGMPTFRIPSDELATAAKTDSSGSPTPAALASQAKIQAAIKAVTKLRFNEVGGLILPSDVYDDEDGKPSSVKKWDFSIISSTGQRAIDARTAARDYDRALARVLLMQFLHLGDRSGGSNGLSENQSSIALRSIRAVADKIAGEFNLKAVPLLWLVNAAPKEFMPQLVAGNLHEESIEKLGAFIRDLGMAEPLFADDPALKDSVLESAGLRGTRHKFKDVAPKPLPDTSPFAPKPAGPMAAAVKPQAGA